MDAFSTGSRIKKYRKDRGMTQKELAKKTGIAEVTIRQYEAGKYQPKFPSIVKIANALNINPMDLLGEKPISVSPDEFDKIRNDFLNRSGNQPEIETIYGQDGTITSSIKEKEMLTPENQRKLEDYRRLLLLDQQTKEQ